MFTKIYSDILLVYKNIIHWNISKLIISIASFLFWILLALPFLILATLIWYLSPIDWKSIFWAFYMGNSIDMFLLWEVFKNIAYFIFIIFFLVFAVLFFFVWTSYKYPLLSKLYLSYIDGEKRNFFRGNDYFSFKTLWKYTIILAWQSLYLILPLIIFIALLFILVLLFGWFESVSYMMWHSALNIFSVIVFILFLLSLVSFFYIIYRVQFALFSFVDKSYYDPNKKARYYVKDSISITKSYKNFGKFVLLMISMIVILSPIFYIESNIVKTQEELELLVSAKTDDIFKQNMTDDNKYEVSVLEKKYINYNDDDLKYELSKYNTYVNIWGILYFIILGNIETMLFISFYRRVLLEDKILIEEDKNETDDKNNIEEKKEEEIL